jgi:hypothetical protein
MATVDQVYKLLQAGKTAPGILAELHIPPSKLKTILESRRMSVLDRLQREVIPIARKLMALETAMDVPRQLQKLAGEKNELGRRACEALLEYLNLNYPPGMMHPRSSVWD